jgi:TnpA family transposase
MEHRAIWDRSLAVIDRLYRRDARISYRQFVKQWTVGRHPADGLSSNPSHPTISRIWRYYKRKHNLKSIRGKRLINWVLVQFGERKLDPEMSRPNLEGATTELMATQGLVKPSSYRFRRSIRAAVRIFRRNESAERFARLERTIGTSINEISIVKRWAAAQELLKYPPASVGRANLPKMVAEYGIFQELSTALTKNNINPRPLLDNPDCNRLYRFVERYPPSILRRWEQRIVLEALPFYLAARLRESIDAVLLCFIRKTRLLRSRLHEEVEDTRRDESLTLLERSGRHLRKLQIAIGEALSIGSPTPLQPFQKKISRLYNDRATTLDRNRLYQLIGSRGAYTRKFAHRLVGIQFHGHEPHAKAVIAALQEVLRFAPFDENISRIIVEELNFLQVPPNLLKQRQVFEPVVMITLADYLWSSRMSSSLSYRFSNIWVDIPERNEQLEPMKWVERRRRQFDNVWKNFEISAPSQNLVMDGRLHITKPPALHTIRRRAVNRIRHDKLISKLPIVSILEVILLVHKSTGYLDEFRLRHRSPHQLENEERLRLTSSILITTGMNVGLRETATVLGGRTSVGRVQNFTDNYITKENLEAALRRLLIAWDERKMGKPWGPGRLVSVDGRVVGAFQNNLLSRYHYRKGRSGMTVYWFRRDDGIATRVKPLGNQEWEAWHVLDELLHPLTDHTLDASCGDTQGQFLALWGLSEIVGKEILARFRRPSRVQLYKPSARNRAGLKNLRVINWSVIERGLPSIYRLAEAIKERKIQAVDVLRRWHLYDDTGCDVGEALRELGKVKRTEYLLRYALERDLQYRIRAACNDAEAWNSFHEAIFWGNGGKLRSNDPVRQEEILLALTLLMNSIIFYNVETYGKELKKAGAPTPVIWDHIQVLGKYQFRRSWISKGSPIEK